MTLELDRIDTRQQTDGLSRDARAREVARLRTVLEVGRKINSILDLDKLLNETVRLIRQTFGFSQVTVWLVDQYDPEYLSLGVSSSDSTIMPEKESKRMHISKGMVGWVIRNEQTRLANDVRYDPYYIHCDGTAAELDLPLKINTKCIGVLNIEQPNVDAFDMEDVAVLEILADQIATAIENAGLNSRAREAAVAEERNRLARELHDSTVQSLIGLGRQIDLLRCDIDEKLLDSTPMPDAIEKRLTRLHTNLESTIQSLRLLSRQLQPQILEDLGLVAALESLVSDIERYSKLKITTDMHGDELTRFHPKQLLHIYRLAQEALSNVVKHSQAKNVRLELWVENGWVYLIIADDGRGFEVPDDLTKLALTGGMGVLNMRQRARESGGSLKISSEPGVGTTLTLAIPIGK